ncbi:hypothetical protein J6590_046267 [Homalodisca vitripennis]|nr:hypothetical protein J6590_046267 [Homalodisca vitripennis]
MSPVVTCYLSPLLVARPRTFQVVQHFSVSSVRHVFRISDSCCLFDPRKWQKKKDLFVKSGDNRKVFFEKLLSNDGSLFKNFTRMNRQDFDYLIEKVTPLVKKADTNCRDAIPVQVRVLLTLRYLATGDSYASLQNFNPKYW